MNREICEHGHWAGEDGSDHCIACGIEGLLFQNMQAALTHVYEVGQDVIALYEESMDCVCDEIASGEWASCVRCDFMKALKAVKDLKKSGKSK